MNWLAQWLKDRCEYADEKLCIDCTRSCAAQTRLCEGAQCSPELIGILLAGGITHPQIAARIVAFADASPEDFDRIVHKKRRGKCRPQKKHTGKEDQKQVRKRRAVVVLDRLGKEITRYASTEEACEAVGTSITSVYKRCICDFGTVKDEFARTGFTYRYADEWDELTDAQKKENISQCQCRRR